MRGVTRLAAPLFLERYRAYVLSNVPEAVEVCVRSGAAAATVLD